MNETVVNLVQGLLDTMDELGVPLGGNTQKLALLDAESADKHITDLEDKLEQMEWSEEDFYTLDKDNLELLVTKVMRKMFFAKDDGEYMSTDLDDFDSFVDDAVAEFGDEFETATKKTKSDWANVLNGKVDS